ncbi:MAG: DUF58 domain-containing protein [Micavibrio sp.]|nr:MAG: DUF58 domain-containing protein [Micavibrio sp.]
MDDLAELLQNDSLPALIVAAERVAMSVVQGSHGRRRVGMGESFWQFRNYMPSDPVRSIDWRQSAKRDSHFIRQTEWEAAQTIVLWHDASGSMDYSSDPKKYPEKRRYAMFILLALAGALLRGGENVLIPGNRPVQGYPFLGHAAEMMMRQNRPLSDLGRLPRDAHGIFITDGLADPDQLAEDVHRLSLQRVTGQFVHLVDPAERSLPFSGHAVFLGLEEGEAPQKIQDVRAVREAYLERFAEHGKKLERLAKAAGWAFHECGTDTPPAEAVLPIYETLMYSKK